jgi:hypothetical protein
MAAAKRGSNGVYVALLRGINVGGNNIVSMSALKESFERTRSRSTFPARSGSSATTFCRS